MRKTLNSIHKINSYMYLTSWFIGLLILTKTAILNLIVDVILALIGPFLIINVNNNSQML